MKVLALTQPRVFSFICSCKWSHSLIICNRFHLFFCGISFLDVLTMLKDNFWCVSTVQSFDLRPPSNQSMGCWMLTRQMLHPCFHDTVILPRHSYSYDQPHLLVLSHFLVSSGISGLSCWFAAAWANYYYIRIAKIPQKILTNLKGSVILR